MRALTASPRLRKWEKFSKHFASHPRICRRRQPFNQPFKMTAHPPFLTIDTLTEASAKHGFFSRRGGVSAGDYASLNAGPGSDDNPDAVARNRALCAHAIGADPARLTTLYQVHSPMVVEAPFDGAPPQADGLVSTQPGVALGVLAADCMPFLFIDAKAGVVGAAHAGWRGALAGVLEATVDAMVALGARAPHIAAAVGPCLRQPNFEVGLDLVAAFKEKYPQSEDFFAPGVADDKRQLDLVSFGKWRLAHKGVEAVADADMCTLANSADYFSYRAARQAGWKDYGRNLSLIMLPE